jgi:hypothetical protein
VERIKNLKKALVSGISALQLAVTTLPLEAQPLTHSEPITCSIENINQRYSGIKLHDRLDQGLSNRFLEYNPRFSLANLEATTEMICAVSEGLDQLPSPNLYINNIIFFPFNYRAEGEHLSDPFDEGENWIIIYYRQNLESQQELLAAQSKSNLTAPNYYLYLQHILVHEAGHGLAEKIASLWSLTRGEDTQSRSSILDEENPLYRTFAEVAGFEFIQPEEICDEENSCRLNIVYATIKVNGSNMRLRRTGWIRNEEFMERAQISRYEQRQNDIEEAFAEYLRAHRFNPNLLDQNQLQYFDILIEGLNSEDPDEFLHYLVVNPEEVLLFK